MVTPHNYTLALTPSLSMAKATTWVSPHPPWSGWPPWLPTWLDSMPCFLPFILILATRWSSPGTWLPRLQSSNEFPLHRVKCKEGSAVPLSQSLSGSGHSSHTGQLFIPQISQGCSCLGNLPGAPMPQTPLPRVAPCF